MKYTYSQIVGILKERNRPSGGIKTIQNVVKNAYIKQTDKILEIGSNTGFSSVNLNLLSGAKVVGIDVEENSLKEARLYAKLNNVSKSVKFKKASATSLPFKDNSFDIV